MLLYFNYFSTFKSVLLLDIHKMLYVLFTYMIPLTWKYSEGKKHTHPWLYA